MFNILYLFLYKYLYLCSTKNVSLFFLEKNNGIRVYGDIVLKKKSNVFFLKKRLFFFKFLLKPVKSLVHGMNKKKKKKIKSHENIFLFNSIVKKRNFSLLKKCFKTISSRRPIKNLYYRISRSRCTLASINNSLRSNKSINFFIKKTHSMSSFSVKNSFFLIFDSPLINYCFLDALKFSNKYHSLFYKFKKKLKFPDREFIGDYFRNRNKKMILKKKKFIGDKKKETSTESVVLNFKNLKYRHKRKKLPLPKYFKKLSRNTKSLNSVLKKYRIKFFNFFYKSSLFKKYYHSKSPKMAITFFLYRNLGKLHIRSNLNSLAYSNKFLTKKTIFFSNITGVKLVKSNNSFKNIKRCPIKSKFINIYNLKTYNWLITI